MSAGSPTIGGLKRLTYDPPNDNFGNLIAGQDHWSVNFTGGVASNLLLNNCTFNPPVGGGGGIPASTIHFFPTGSSATVSAANTTLICTSTSSAQNVSIPAAAAGNVGQDIVIKNLSSATSITITPASGTIDLNANVVITVVDDSTTLRSDGISNWVVI